MCKLLNLLNFLGVIIFTVRIIDNKVVVLYTFQLLVNLPEHSRILHQNCDHSFLNAIYA